MRREPVRNLDRIVCVSCTWRAARLENKSTGRPVNPTVKTHTSHCVWGFVVCTSTCTHYSCCMAPELQYSACLFIHMPLITHQTVARVMLVYSLSVLWFFLRLLWPQLVLWLLCVKDVDCQSNQKAFSQDSLLRGYAQTENNPHQKQAQTWLLCISAACQCGWHRCGRFYCLKFARRFLLFFKCPLFLINPSSAFTFISFALLFFTTAMNSK